MTATSKKIPRHEELTEAQRKSNMLKRQMLLQNKEFKKAQKLNRPKLDREKTLEDFGEYAEVTAKALAELTIKVMALQTAFGYAEKMISQDIEGDGVEWDTQASMRIAERIQTVIATQIMLTHFNVSKILCKSIIEKTIAKQFGIAATLPSVPPKQSNIPSISAQDMKSILDEYTASIDTKP